MSTATATFVWYELMTTDAAAGESFYRAVVGWNAQDATQPAMKYTMFLAGQAPVAGLMTLPKEACDAGARPAWNGYIGTDDVDGCAVRIARYVGRVPVPPTDIPNTGRLISRPQAAAKYVGRGRLPRSIPPAAVGWLS